MTRNADDVLQVVGPTFDWNATRTDYPRESCVHQLFEEQAARTPEAVAVVCDDRQLTYRELNTRANQLAHHLVGLGVGPETLVGICLDRSAELVIGLLAILKAGGAYLPLDPSFPEDRLRYMLEDSRAPVVLTEQRLKSRLGTFGGKFVFVDQDHEAPLEPSAPFRPEAGSADDLMYVIYTSGSTGRPKGVLVEHRSVSRLVLGTDYARFGTDRVFLFLAPATFDASTFEVWGALLHGARLVIAPPGVPDLEQLEHLIQDERVTTLWLTASLFNRIVEDRPSLLAGVDEVLTGGEALSVRHIRLAHRLLPESVTLINGYGPTECTTFACCHRIPRELPDDVPSIPIGRPIANTQAYILDGERHPVPAGVAGELYLGGEGLARGYLNQPALTAERFIPNPFAGDADGSRLYRTGDLCRYLPDGNIEYLGRLDQQVKIRGFRIELGEIEATLARMPGWRQCAVIAREDVPGDRRLVAYGVPDDPSAPPLIGNVRDFLARTLPDYMLPAALVVLDALPVSPNGKVDRRALPAPGGDRPRMQQTAIPPRTATEAALAEIWQEVLTLDQVGIDDNFFELGGHSLLATRVIVRVRDTWSVNLTVRHLFEAPTVAGLAGRIEEARSNGAALSGGTLRKVAHDGPLALSFAQRRLWFLDQYELDHAVYNIPYGLRLSGHLEIAALRRSLAQLVQRHQTLRTTFPTEGGEPRQVIVPALEVDLPVTDLGSLPPEQHSPRVEELARAEARRPFDLEHGPLLRARLLRLTGTEHVLLLTLHHIVADGWSMAVLFGELSQLYQGYHGGHSPALPELPVQYADYTVWQQELLQGDVLEQQTGYWKRRLNGAPTLLELPTDFPRPAAQSYRGARQSVEFSADLSAALGELSRRENVTLFMTLVAAFQVLLSRYSGQTDVSLGAAVAGRNRTELEGLIGFFVNTLVLRTDLSGNPAFRELLGRVRDVTLGAYAHQDLPFEKLVEELHPRRSLSHSPLFQVMLVLQNAPRSHIDLPDLEIEAFDVHNGTSKFDLTLSLTETTQGLRGDLEYNTDLFRDATITRLLEHLSVLLRGIVADPACRIGELPLLTEAERRQVLVDWNATQTDYPRESCVHQLFEEQAARTPEAVAVVCDDRQLTYRELNTRANQLAHHLVGLGVTADHPVVVFLDRSLEFVVSLLAILKAGTAYVPIDANEPETRLRMLIEDTNAAIVLARTERQPASLPERVSVALLDEVALRLEQEPGDNLSRSVQADSLAYVIYTSGSTGRPKGVMVPHRGVTRLVCGANYAPFDRNQRFLLLASPAFDASTFELWGALLHGAICVVYSGSRPDLDDLEITLRDQRITCLWLTSSLFNAIVDHRPEMLAGLSHLLTGGEALSADHVRRFRQRCPAVRLVNGYGPTESTTFACTFPITGEIAPGQSSIPIGCPISNTRTYVFDKHGQPAPVGVPGELYLGGDGVAHGYLNRPELTAEKFIPDPFCSEPGATLFRTGDRVRWRADGNLEFLGRLDQQVKLRGFRIEPGEIETALEQHPAVARSVVLLREDVPGDKRLAAYLVPASPGSPPDSASLRRHVQSQLPEYMVPSAFIVLETLPLTANGKVDRLALPAPEIDRSKLAETYRAPRSPVEESLAEIWEDLLRLPRVGIDDNFFELGGHSLLATRVIVRVRDTWSVNLTVRHLFEAPTVAGLAGRIEEARSNGAALSGGTLRKVAHDGPLALSFAQRRLWFLDQYELDHAVYNIPYGLRLSGHLEIAALRRSLAQLVQRHQTLRTTFLTEGGEPRQVIVPALEVDLPVTDLGSLPPEQHSPRVEELARAEARRPFDLEHGPLLRARLLRLTGTEHVLLLTLHHIVADGWSMAVLFGELSQLYQGYHGGHSPALPELPVQYADYTVWQQELLQGDVLEQQTGYWKRRLNGAPTLLELPTDFPRPAAQSYRGARQSVEFSADLSAALGELSRRENVTLFMTLVAAFQVLLSRYSGQTDVSLGAAVAGRNRTELEGLIGFFVNTLVLRTDLSGNPAFRELLGRVRDVTLGAYAHQDLPFEKLVEELHPRRSLSHSPLFQVMLVLQNAPRSHIDLPDLEIEAFDVHNGTSKFDLTLSLTETTQGLRGDLEYNTDLFRDATITRLLEHLSVLLRGIVADPACRIGELPLLTEAERRQVLVDWNATQTDYPRESCVHQLFEEQAARTPEAVAVVCDDRQLTYRELNTRANQLAHHLVGLGVGPETLVGICLDRSAGLVIGLLAILKAGGAYLPLDPSFPEDRLRYMLEDSRAPVVLTEPRLQSRLGTFGGKFVFVDQDHEAPLEPSAPFRPEPGSADDLMYVIYTSGSTGRPKGVQIEHRAMMNFLSSMQQTPGISADDVVLAMTTLSFDIAGLEIFLPLVSGARLVLIDRETARNGQLLANVLERHGVTLLQGTPATYRLLLQSGWQGNDQLKILVGGEALDRELAAELGRDANSLWNMYGPTETTIWSTVWNVKPDTPVTIGRPIANTQAYILDGERHPVPAGVAGELYLGGEGLARGYLNQPALTAERFIPNPFAGDADGSRLYRTGDLCRYLPDGNIEYLGRLDQQVKIRGFRIELGEIEATLARMPGWRQCAVIAREDVPGDRRLVAYGVPDDPSAPPLIGNVRDFLARTLPDYMLPAALVVLDALPVSPNGKVDRRALPAPGGDRPRMQQTAIPPRTATEAALAEIWREVLTLDQVGIDDNFFELGGHSLLAVRLFSRIESALGRKLPLHALFQGGTIANLATLIEQDSDTKNACTIVPIQPEGARLPLFVMPSGTGSLLLWQRFVPYLEVDQPVFGVTLPATASGAPLFSDFETLAATCVERLIAFRPEGPFQITGFSIGAVLAYEVARQLAERGREVCSLVIIDVHAQGKNSSLIERLKLLPSYLLNFPLWFLDDILQSSPARLRERLTVNLHKTRKRLFGKFFAEDERPPEDEDLPKPSDPVSFAYIDGFTKYRPARSALRMSLIRTRSQSPFEFRRSDYGWARVAQKVGIRVVSGCYHHQMVHEPHVGRVAEIVQSALGANEAPRVANS
jgi:amino acid adenylation domain-containing protein